MLLIPMENAAGWTIYIHQNLLMALSKTLNYYINSFSLITGR